MSLDAWHGEREERDDRLIETGAIPDYRGRLAGRALTFLPKPTARCVVCTASIPVIGLCPRCVEDRDDMAAHWSRFLPTEEE